MTTFTLLREDYNTLMDMKKLLPTLAYGSDGKLALAQDHVNSFWRQMGKKYGFKPESVILRDLPRFDAEAINMAGSDVVDTIDLVHVKDIGHVHVKAIQPDDKIQLMRLHKHVQDLIHKHLEDELKNEKC